MVLTKFSIRDPDVKFLVSIFRSDINDSRRFVRNHKKQNIDNRMFPIFKILQSHLKNIDFSLFNQTRKLKTLVLETKIEFP